MSRPHILIYRDFLLNPSETFIKSQGEALKRFTPIYGGLRLVEGGIELPADRTVTIQGRSFLRRVDNALFARIGLSSRLGLAMIRNSPGLVHAHFGVDATHVARLARAFRVPLVVTLHDYDVTTSDEDLLKLHPSFARYIEQRPTLNRAAAVFLAVSRFLKEKALARGFAAEKVLVHYIGIDVNRFEPVINPDREPVVLFVGRLVEKKGCAYLIRAMAAVQARRPETELVVIGDGPERAELEKQAASTLGKYRFLGTQTNAEIRRWHARARVFCLSSVTAKSGETEGLPISILEALSVGLPVVATRHAGIPEAVIDGDTGLLAGERDSDALGAHILTLLSNTDLAGRLAAQARAFMCSHFNLERQNERLEAIYEQVVRHPTRIPIG